MTGSERPLSGTTSEKKRRPQPYWGGENSGNALELASNALNYRVWGIPAVLSRGIPGKALSLRAFPGSCRNFPEFLPESPSRTGGVAQSSGASKQPKHEVFGAGYPPPMQSPWITFHHCFVFGELFLVFFASWISTKNSGQISLSKYWEFYIAPLGQITKSIS